MKFRQLIEVAKAKKLLVFAVFMSTLILFIAITFLLPKSYTATAALIIDSKNPDPLNGLMLQGNMVPGYVATQIDILQSERVALKVIDDLKFRNNPALQSQWAEQTDRVGSFDSWLANSLLRGLDVKPARESSVIYVSYTATDPTFSSVMANAFVSAYMKVNLELRVEPARRFSLLFNEQLQLSRKAVEAAQSKLSEYQKNNGLVATDERFDVEMARLNDLSNQLVASQSIAAQSTSRSANAGDSIAEVLANPVISALKADKSRQEARLKELTSTLGSSHPTVLQTWESIRQLERSINIETAKVAGSLSINSKASESQVIKIKAALDLQRAKVLAMKEQRDAAALLQADVVSAQRAYDALQSRFAQISLESQNDQTTASLLKTAAPPSSPSSPKLYVNLPVGVVVALLLSIAVAAAFEYFDKRIRVLDDLDELPGYFIGISPYVPPSKTATERQELTAKTTFPRLPS